MRLKLKVLLLAIVPLIGSLALIALAVVHQARDLAARERALVESATMASKEGELRHYVDMAMSALAPLYESGRNDDATKEQAIRLLASLDFGSDGYFFLYDMAGKNLMHPRQPELVGQDLWQMRDVNGTLVIQSLIARAHEGGGFVRYVWNKPSIGGLAPKLGYAVSLPGWNWMLGTGIYLDDVQAAMARVDEQVTENVTTTMWWIAGIAVLSVALIGVCGLVLNMSESRIADAKLRMLARQVVQSQEAERAHLSRELHDSTGQILVSIKLLMESAIARLGDGAPSSLTKALDRLKTALGEVREISHRLRPAELDVLGLPTALEHLARECAEHSGMAIGVRVRGEPVTLVDEVNTVLFRIAQEALTNIQKHAQASRVSIWLTFGKRGLRLRITDDGRGFNVEAIRLHPKRGIGLRNMRERLSSVGGRITVRSSPGRTQVVADVPAGSAHYFEDAKREAA
jgi:two-component system NarL family sensor kinase